MKKPLFLFLGLLTINLVQAQLVTLTPSNATGEDAITVTFDATQGNAELVGAAKVYMHTGVVIDGPDGVDWTNVVGNWGADDGVGEMTKVENESDKWQLILSPTAREYYSVPASETIFRLSMVFRSADGSTKATMDAGEYGWGEVAGNGDIYVNLNAGDYVSITSPTDSDVYIESGGSIAISAEASNPVTLMTLELDEGAGFSEVATVSSGTGISFSYTPSEELTLGVRVTAVINGTNVDRSSSFNVLLRDPTNQMALPPGIIKGINYHDDDETRATLALEAPGKDFAYVVGDFNDWTPTSEYLMNQTPDGELFWYELTDLIPGQEYVFQYWVDGAIKVGDPYADKVADPWNDQFIPSDIYPDPTGYDRTENEMATILQTGQSDYVWEISEDNWTPPAKKDLIVYELLVRDFIGTHSYTDLIDTLGYLKRLGVNAIELMPIMEFEGNESWGYNPVFFFAPDKYYGTKDQLKRFIEVAHQQGFAVILDMVLNHTYGQSPLVKLYADNTYTPTDDNPWLNRVPTHPFNVGSDFNHDSPYTRDFVDTVNHYWLNEYHFDGYRFDLSKGFTQKVSGDDVGLWGQRDPGRISNLNRMNNEIQRHSPGAYVILEHFADNDEEEVLGNAGMLLWRNLHGNYKESLIGNSAGVQADSRIHVSYMESHDEERQMVDMLANGNRTDSYNIRDEAVALERKKMAAAFLLLQPGPKMLWQFGELGYDVGINFNGRVGNKPLPWGDGNLGLYEDDLRQYLYQAYAAIINLRLDYPEAVSDGAFSITADDKVRTLTISSDQLSLVLIGNFGSAEKATNMVFPSTGTWYDYFSGTERNVANNSDSQTLQAGEFYLYTDRRVSSGFPGVVETYRTPVSISPSSFRLDDAITITFDATKAFDDGTNGLVGATSVSLTAGLVTDNPKGNTLNHLVEGTSMTKVEGEIWEISLTPREFFSLTEEATAFRLGMYFEDANGNLGKGYRNRNVFFDIQSNAKMVTFDPEAFFTTQEVSLIFDAALGDQGLINADKVYAHSGVVLTPGSNPTSFGSNVIGNWGADDGVGQMTKIAGTNKWELTYTPNLRSYYDISTADSVYWVSVVFRSADGNTKGSDSSGEYDWGFIAANGDIFVKVTPPEEQSQPVLGAEDQLGHIFVYPNPSSGKVQFSGLKGPANIEVYDVSGRILKTAYFDEGAEFLDLSNFRKGSYILKIDQSGLVDGFRLIIVK